MANPIQAIEPTLISLQRETAAQEAIRVLIIDDDSADFFVVNRILKQSSNRQFRIVHIDNFDDGVAELQNGTYDVVLIDYFIGNRAGTDIFAEMKDQLTVPVIVLTGSGDKDVEDAALEAGAFDFLDKSALTGATLVRSLDFAIKRFQIEEKIREKQERLRRACENAEAAHFSKSEFLSFLGSELRTPLNAIVGFSGAMKEDALTVGLPTKYREYSDTIHSSGRHLMNLISDLLDISDTEADAYDARERRFKRYRTWIVDQQQAHVSQSAIENRALA